MLFETDSIYSL